MIKSNKNFEETKMDQALITLIILVIVALLFLTEIIPVAVSALSATVALVFFGILTPQEAFSGFSNSNVILFSGMFVVGVAMLESGLAQTIGNFIVRKVGGTQHALIPFYGFNHCAVSLCF